MSEVKVAIEKEVLEELETLKQMNLGGEEYEKTVAGLTKLTGELTKIAKDEAEREEKAEAAKADAKDRKIKNWLTGAGIAVPSIITVWGTLKSFKFEETGTITTMLGRGFIQKLLPKK